MIRQANIDVPFQLASLIKASTPEGAEGNSWYRYTITQGSNEITGVRSGTHAEVTQLVNEMIDRMNERRAGKSKPRSKAAPAAPAPAST